MAVEPAEPPKTEQALTGNRVECVERRVEPGNVVPLRREVDVPVRVAPAETGRVQLLEQEERHDVHRAEARAEMSRAGTFHGDERVEPAHVGEDADSRVPVDVRGADAVELGLRDQRELGHALVGGRCGVTTSARSAPSRSSSVFSQRKSASLVPAGTPVKRRTFRQPVHASSSPRPESSERPLGLAVLRPAQSHDGIRSRVDRRLEEHRSSGLRHAVEHPEQREVMDRVVEHAEEEDEVERLELEQLPRLAEVAVHEPVGATEGVDPLGVEVPIRGEVREDQLRR